MDNWKVFTFQGTPRRYTFKEESHLYGGGYLQRLIANGFPSDGLYYLIMSPTLSQVHPRWTLFSRTPNQDTYGVFPFLVKNGTCVIQASYPKQFPISGCPMVNDFTVFEYKVVKHRGTDFTTDVPSETPGNEADVYTFLIEVAFQ